MTKTTNTLKVFLNNRYVARLWLDNKYYCFQYIVQDTPPISVTLPVRIDPYLNDTAKAYFANLLPEGPARDSIESNLGIIRGNDFELLEKIGGDCAGAITVFPEYQEPDRDYHYIRLADSELAQLIRELPHNPLYTGRNKKVRLSLAGAQNKIALFVKEGMYHLPENGAPTSHILKVPITNISGIHDTVENETFVMMLARALGLNVPDVDLLNIGETPVFITKRYDRVEDNNGILQRLLQEDFCQLLQLEPTVKYQNAGGPALEDCAEKIREHSTDSISDIEQLLRWVLFNVIIGNTDAHAKNISLLWTPTGLRLAPFYDLLSTTVYGSYHDSDLAMSIGRQYSLERLTRENWTQLAEFMDIRYRLIQQCFSSIYELFIPATTNTLEQFEGKFGPNETINTIARIAKIKLNTLAEYL